MSIEKAVLKILIERRKSLRMSREDVAKLVSKSTQIIYRIEANSTSLTFDLFIKLCEVYNIQPSIVIEQAKSIISPIENTTPLLKSDEEKPSHIGLVSKTPYRDLATYKEEWYTHPIDK